MSPEQHQKVPRCPRSANHTTPAHPRHLSDEPREQMRILMPSLRRASALPPSSTLPPSPPPPSPCPWLWRCHSCYTIYRLAVTRRCLDCDHSFCLGEPAAGTAATAASSPPKGRKRRRRGRGGPCKAEFDYTGWKARGAWRRTLLLNGQDTGDNGTNNNTITTTTTTTTTTKAEDHSEAKPWGDEHGAAAEGPQGQARFEDRRERLFLRRRHNCFVHCDFPSECHHSLFRAQQEGRPILRAAEALDAAAAAAEAAWDAEGRGRRAGEEEEKEEEEEGGAGRRRARLLTVHEYKERRAAGRCGQSSPGPGEGLSTVDEEQDEEEEAGDSVSPCSPTSPDPPGDLMREVVSPLEKDGDSDDGQPVSPSGRRRASLLVTTDTPADFATTAAPLGFEDTYSDDDEDDDDDDNDDDDDDQELGAHKVEWRARSRRKIAQLTGEGPESFGPFFLDTSGPSPTSPLAPSACPGRGTTGQDSKDNSFSRATARDIEAAYSEQAWFTCPPTPASTGSELPPPKSPERAGKRDRMLALLGRRSSSSSSGGGAPSSPTRSSPGDVFNMPSGQQHQQRKNQQQQADATAVAGEEWESWSDSSTSSSSTTTTTTTCSAISLLSSSSIMDDDDDDTDADGDVPMHDVAAATDPQPPAKDVDDDDDVVIVVVEDRGSPVIPTGGHHAYKGGHEAEDLGALLRMRNAFMRGDMM